MSDYDDGWNEGFDLGACTVKELQAENAKLRALIAEALSGMEYYHPSLGEMWLVQDSDITAMQDAINGVRDA